MDNKEIVNTLEEMWEIMFKEMRTKTFKDLQERGMIEKFIKAYVVVLNMLKEKADE